MVAADIIIFHFQAMGADRNNFPTGTGVTLTRRRRRARWATRSSTCAAVCFATLLRIHINSLLATERSLAASTVRSCRPRRRRLIGTSCCRRLKRINPTGFVRLWRAESIPRIRTVSVKALCISQRCGVTASRQPFLGRDCVLRILLLLASVSPAFSSQSRRWRRY